MRTSFAVQDMTIHRIVEKEYGFTLLFEFLPTLTQERFEENRSWMEQGAYDAKTGNCVLCFQSYVVKTPHHNILVDACIGNNKTFPRRPEWNGKTDGNWMAALKAAGLAPEDIDFVMCTHMHGDHVGWNTRLENGRWVPTFPKGALPLLEKGIRVLDGTECPFDLRPRRDQRKRAADHRGEPRRTRHQRPCAQRPHPAAAHPRPHA